MKRTSGKFRRNVSGRPGTALLDRLRRDQTYRRLFAAAFDRTSKAFSVDNVVRSIASFERTIISARSPYDRYHSNRERDAISAAARHEFPLSALLLISPVADFSRLSPRINPFTIHRHIAFGQALRRPKFDWRFARSPKLNAIDDIADAHAPLCLVHVKNDWLVDHGHSVALYERANEPKELHIIDIPGNYHADRIFNVAADEVDPIIAEFLARTTR